MKLDFVSEEVKWIFENGHTFLCVRSPKLETVSFCESAQRHPKKWKVSISEFLPKRTLDANAYYWALIGKVAKELKYTNNYTHNLMLRAYGERETIDGRNVYITIPATDEAEKQVDEMEHAHLKATSNLRMGKDGKMYRTYVMLKGSSAMTKKGFCRLLDGLIEEAKALDIETLTPAQLSALRYENK